MQKNKGKCKNIPRKHIETLNKYTKRSDMASRQKAADAKKVLRSQGGKPKAYTNPYLMAYRLAKYVATCEQNKKPLTETGLTVALNVMPQTFRKYAAGEMDAYTLLKGVPCRESEAEVKIALDNYRQIEELQDVYKYLTDNERKDLVMSEVIGKARLLVSLEREERLSAVGKVSDIFIMKAREGWQDQADRQDITINIKNDDAIAALKALGYTPIEGESS